MITQQAVNTTVTSNTFDTKRMGVIADSRALNLILKNLYTSPIDAIVRELSTNAVDAHTSIGNTDPYHIQLPSQYDTNFIIRDFGPGLDEKEIDLYLNTLFSSSKSKTNEQIGGFGLGSKSPFSLVDSFNIESFKNGFKYSGLWYRQDDGEYLLVVTNVSPTKEPNGLKFIVTCNSIDVGKFSAAANTQLFNLALKPMFLSDIDNLESVYDFAWAYNLATTYDNIKVYTQNDVSIPSVQSYTQIKNNFFASVGGVVYPVDHFFLPEESENFKNFVTYITSRGNKIVIEIPVGSVTIPLNRESIEHTKDNLKVLIDAVDKTSNLAVIEHFKPFYDFIGNSVTKPTYANFISLLIKHSSSEGKSCNFPDTLSTKLINLDFFGTKYSDAVLSTTLGLTTPNNFYYNFKKVWKNYIQGIVPFGTLMSRFTSNIKDINSVQQHFDGSYSRGKKHVAISLPSTTKTVYLIQFVEGSPFTSKRFQHTLDTNYKSHDDKTSSSYVYKGPAAAYDLLLAFLIEMYEPFGITIVSLKTSDLLKPPIVRKPKVVNTTPVVVASPTTPKFMVGLRTLSGYRSGYNSSSPVSYQLDSNGCIIPLGKTYCESDVVYLFNSDQTVSYTTEKLLQFYEKQFKIETSFIATANSYQKYFDMLESAGVKVVDPSTVFSYYENLYTAQTNVVYSPKEAILEIVLAAVHLERSGTHEEINDVFSRTPNTYHFCNFILKIYESDYKGIVINTELDAYVRANIIDVRYCFAADVDCYMYHPADAFKDIRGTLNELEYARIVHYSNSSSRNNFDPSLITNCFTHISNLIFETKVYKYAIRYFQESGGYTTFPRSVDSIKYKILTELGLTWNF